jgi:hypothetical protein
VKFVGHLVGSNERAPLLEKVRAILDIPEPQTKKMLRSFLGTCNYYRCYIPHFSNIAFPLTELTKTAVKTKIRFDETQKEAFETLKKKLGEATALYSPDTTKPMLLHTDSSDYAIGAVLSQQTADMSAIYPIAFSSAKLTQTQRNYSVIERESYAVIHALNKFDHLIHNTDIVLYVDHNPLTYITQCAPSSPKLMRWALSLTRYRIKIHHLGGKNNIVADYLSRCYT